MLKWYGLEKQNDQDKRFNGNSGNENTKKNNKQNSER